MKKSFFAVSLLLCACVLFACAGTEGGNYVYLSDAPVARFMTNVDGEKAALSTDRDAVGDNLLFSSCPITVGGKLTPPAAAPERSGYVFGGWATDPAGSVLFDFDKPVFGGVTLYAKWSRDESKPKDTYTEPVIAYEEVIDDTAPLSVKAVFTTAVAAGAVDITKAGVNILNDNADNVLPYLRCTRSADTTIRSAVYDSGKITVAYSHGGKDLFETINVFDVTGTLSVDASYETKAAKYEDNVHIAPHNVIMAGSSSMENWSTSVLDMKPVTTANVGIGGTVAEQWTEKLARRLIYPFNPRAVILYVGINNIINAGKTGAQTGDALTALFDDIHSNLPAAHVYFIMINKVPGYTSKYGEIDIANGMVEQYAADKSYMTLIDAGSGLIKKSGKTNSAYFLTDGLHMSLSGYVIWGKAVKEAFIAKEKEIYNL